MDEERQHDDSHQAHWADPEAPAPRPPLNDEPVDASYGQMGSDRKDGKKPKRDWTWRDWLPLVFDGVVSVATVVGLYFLILQWNQTEEALNEARKANRLTELAQAKADADGKAQDAKNERMVIAAEGSATAGKINADAARRSANAAATSAAAAAASSSFENARYVDEQRAKVILDGIGVTPFVAGQRYTVTITLMNTGRSAASAFRQNGYATPMISGGGLFFPATPEIDDRAGTAPVQAGKPSVVKFDSDEPLAPADAEALNARPPKLTMYVHGRVRYIDRFGQTHHLRFCRAYNNAAGIFSASCAIPDEED